jgi:purine nucleosidase
MEVVKKKVIIDTDMGWDDVLSILYLMKNPSIEIIGITITGCGETYLRWGTIIAQTLMELGNQVQAKICVGASTPLKFNHVFPQLFKDDMNDIMGLIGSLNPVTLMSIEKQSAWKFISDVLNQTEENITILSLGGFTNLAKMLELYPSTSINKITEIYAMAGAVYVDGNVAALNCAQPDWNQGPIYATNYVAEWNVFVDPVATKKVFASNIPITLVPLDACDYVILNSDYINKITATDSIATLVKDIFKKKTGSSDEGNPVPIFDPLATMIMADGLEGYQVHSEYLDVNIEDTEVDNQCGRTYVVNSGSRKITIVQGVSQHAFATNFSNVINRDIV